MSTKSVLLAAAGLLLPLVSLAPNAATVVEAAPGDPVLPVEGRRTISGDFDTTCAILADTTVQCWGDGSSGQIGDGAGIDRPRPTTVSGLTGVVDISGGDDTICAVTSDAVLWCWGTDSNGELGDGDLVSDTALVPQVVPGMDGTLDVTAGYDHVCAAKIDGTAWCWGEGDGGELATGDDEDRESPSQIPGITDAIATAVAEQGSCALHLDKTVSCWGNNGDGEVGNGTTDEVIFPVKVPGVDRAIDIVKTDASGTCVLNDDGTVQCWGDGGADWLDQSPDPVAIGFLDDAVALRAADGVICAVRSDFALWCAGNDDNVLPNDHPDDRETLDPTGIVDVADFTLGEDHGCAVHVNGDVECWGLNGRGGSVGVGAQSETDPLQVPDLAGVTALDAGDETTCAIAEGRVYCWGANRDNLVDTSDDDVVTEPTQVGTATNLVGVSVGIDHACVIDTGDTVSCWGTNSDGQLGVGDTDARTEPTAVTGNFSAVSAGLDHTCGIRLNGAAACWGSNSSGQLGNGVIDSTDVLVPTTIVDGLIDFSDISAGRTHSCGVQANDRIRCWGEGTLGQLGDGLATSSGTPVLVDDPTADFGLVAGGRDATCSTRATTISCWGREYTVQGISTFDQEDTPDDKVISAKWISIDTEDEHACAVEESSGTIHCWGRNVNRVLTSEPSSTTVLEPFPLSLVPESVAVTTGDGHSCALAQDQTVWCWGSNDDGEAGHPSSFDAPQLLELAGPALVEVVPEPPPPPPPDDDDDDTSDDDTSDDDTTDDDTSDDEPSDDDSNDDGEIGVNVFTPVEPARLVETRSGPGNTTVDGEQQGIGRLADGEEIRVLVAERAEIPADATAAVINVTAIGPAGSGFVTAHPCLPDRPLASSLNFALGTNLGNEIIVALDDDGDTCLYTSTATDLAVDVAAYLPAGADYRAVAPARLADTRTNGAADTVDGQFEGDGLLTADSEYRVGVAGRAGIGDDATAAVINVTAIGASGGGFFTIHPCADPRPTAASLNYVAGVNRGNEIIAPLSSDGDVCVYTSTDTHVAIDVVGEVTSAQYVPIVPARYLDTRPGQPAIDGTTEDDGLRTAGQTTTLPIAGIGEVPVGAETVTLNLTAVGPTAVGFATVHPCLPSPPNTASLNYAPGVNGGNEIVVELDDDGDICIFTSQPTHLTADVAGYTTSPE